MDKITILYIDDEINNLHSFQAKFRRQYTILLAHNTNMAYEILNENPSINIIISDQRMPDKTGVEFFESILNTHPEPIRILLTGFSDVSSIIDAINKGQVFRYLEKPWNDHEMQMTIENAFQFYFINHQLKAKNEELQKTNEELNRFVYSASHDLKAPVKSMLGILKLAEAEGRKDDKLIQLLGDSVKRLDYFINNISDYYKNNRMEKEVSEINFRKIIDETISGIQEGQSLNTKDIHFDIAIEQQSPYYNDEFRVNIIIGYLLSNAVKYQKKNEEQKVVSVKITISEKWAKIKIGDNGIGIPQKYQENIYKMFFRATTQSTGSGIGLYIVQETVSKLNGRILVHSNEGEGTLFELELPNEYNYAKISQGMSL
jgi:signal transduction histidine kinase